MQHQAWKPTMAIAIVVPSVTLSNLSLLKKWLTVIAVSAQRFVSYCAHGFGLDVADKPYSRKGYCGLFLHPSMIS